MVIFPLAILLGFTRPATIGRNAKQWWVHYSSLELDTPVSFPELVHMLSTNLLSRIFTVNSMRKVQIAINQSSMAYT